MALTREQVEEKYLQNIHRIFKICESTIDNYLVDNFGSIRVDEKKVIYLDNITSENITDLDVISLMSLIRDKYSDWSVDCNEVERFFVFNYKADDHSFLYLYNKMEDRFANLDIEKSNSTKYVPRIDDDIPF